MPALISTKEMMKEFRVSAATLMRWRRAGMPYLKFGPKKNLYQMEYVLEWIRETRGQNYPIDRPFHITPKDASSGEA